MLEVKDICFSAELSQSDVTADEIGGIDNVLVQNIVRNIREEGKTNPESLDSFPS